MGAPRDTWVHCVLPARSPCGAFRQALYRR